MGKSFVCTCDDVTVEDVRHAIAKGYRDIESIKRYTGFGTGPCQGKNCLRTVARILEEEAHLQPKQMYPFTPRPPFHPVTFGELAKLDPDSVGTVPGPGVPPAEGVYEGDAGFPAPGPHPHRPEGPVPERAETVIIGGGMLGLSLAYNLARLGHNDVVVIEKGYLCSGASGRNGGGIRAQWVSPTNIRIAKRSIELMKSFARDHKINVWFRQGGYLFLAADAKTAKMLEQSIPIHNANGVPTRMLSPGGARDVTPELDTSRFIAAAYNPEDGTFFPWPFLWGYATDAAKLGVKIETFTRVTGLDVEGGKITAVRTDRGTIKCGRVVNCAGAWSPEVARLAGVKLPNEPHRHEACVSEPLKPFLGPLVSVLGNGLYYSQSGRGEIVGGISDPKEPPGLEMGSTLRYLVRYARALTETMPILGRVKVMRQWAGCYDVTPDNQPILGETPDLPNFIQCNGFVGHGFMMGPAMGEIMAKFLLGQERHEIIDRFTLRRFAEGRLDKETFIIG